MKHLNLLLLTCLSCTGLIYGALVFDEVPGRNTTDNSFIVNAETINLDLSGKTIGVLDLSRILIAGPNIQTIKAVSCKIKEVKAITDPNNKLRVIDLSANQLTGWKMNLVAQASSLKKLDLSFNEIREVELIDAQEGLSLDLSYNDILYIKLHEIHRGKPLAYLNLRSNNLTEDAYHHIAPYVPLNEGVDRLFSRAINLTIAGGVGTVACLCVWYYGWFKEQQDRNFRGTAGTELQDEEEGWFFKLTGLGAGAAATIATYHKLNALDDKNYALTHFQWVKGINLDNQKSGYKLLEDIKIRS